MRTHLLRPAAALLLLAGCRADEHPWTEDRIARMTLRERASQMVAPALPAAAADSALAAAGVGGVRLVEGAAEEAAQRLEALARAASLPPLVLADMDRGPGTSLEGATELPYAARGRAAAGEARALGIHLALVSPPDPRDSFAPADAEAAFRRFADELAEAGMLVGVRAFGDAPMPEWDGAAVRALFVYPLQRLVEDGIGAVAPSQATVPALTRDSVPLAANPVAIRGTLRRDLGFGGLVIAELPPGSPLVAAHGEGGAAVRAVAAGADLVAGVADWAAVTDSLVGAVEDGRISPAAVEASVRRIFAAKEALEIRAPAAAAPRAAAVRPAAGELADAVPPAEALLAHREALLVLGRPPAEVLRGCRGVVLATRPGAGAAALSAALAEAFPGIQHLETDRLALRGPLVAPGTPFPAARAECVVAAGFPGARLATVPRVVPPDSTAGPADTLPRRVVRVEFLPRPGSVPAAPSLVVARGTGAAAQRAAAAALTGVDEVPEPPPGTAWPPAPTLRVLPPASAGMRTDSLDAIDRLMRDTLRAGLFDAAAVAIVRRGVVVKLAGYGSVDGRPVDPRSTRFDIASLTKVVGTTSAAMLAVEEGALELDRPVRRHLDAFRGGDRNRITPRHLLTHTSGLSAGAWLYGSARGPEDALARVQRSRLPGEPGESVVYSDFGMILLAAAVERAMEEPIDRLLARRVFVPLGMASTGYLPPMGTRERTVPTAARSERAYALDGVVHDGNAFRLGGVAGHAGLFSTAWDLSVFAQTLLNGGAYGPRRVFRQSTVEAFTRRQPDAGTRALGWDTPAPLTSAGSYFSASSFGHTGYTGTSIWIDPERELFVVLLTNRSHTSGSFGGLLNLRARIADYAALSIADEEVGPRAGSVAARRAARRR